MRSPHCGDRPDYLPPHWGSRTPSKLWLPALYGYSHTTSKFPSLNQVWPHPLFCWYISSLGGNVPRQRTVHITGCGPAAPTVHVTGSVLAGMAEEPAGLKRNRNPKLPSEVAQRTNISWAALTEPNLHTKDHCGSWLQTFFFTAKP